MSKATQKMIDEVLGNDYMQQVLRELNIGDGTAEGKEKVLHMISQNILSKVMLELLTALPPSDRDEFEQLVGGNDHEQLYAFLESRIPDLDRFIFQHARNEFEGTKTLIHRLKQEA